MTQLETTQHKRQNFRPRLHPLHAKRITEIMETSIL